MKTTADRVVVKPLPDETQKTNSGLIVKGNVSEVDEIGLVVKIGPKCTEVKEGEKILYPKGACADFTYKGDTLKLIRESSIMIIYDDESGK